jgi:hypothetical protein
VNASNKAKLDSQRIAYSKLLFEYDEVQMWMKQRTKKAGCGFKKIRQ